MNSEQAFENRCGTCGNPVDTCSCYDDGGDED